MEQIKDMVTLRHEAMKLATQTICATTSFNSTAAYDINIHLAIAKAIENYIKGDAELPEVENHEKTFTAILENMKSNFNSFKPAGTKTPNFKVNQEPT